MQAATLQKKEHVFMTAVNGVQEPGEPNIERMPAMEDLLSAGQDKYVEDLTNEQI